MDKEQMQVDRKQKQVLVVVNSMTDEEVHEIRRAFPSPYAADIDINFNLVYVIPYPPLCYFNIPSMGILIERYHDEAKESLMRVGSHLGVHKKDQWLISGKLRTEVLRLANRLGSTFILASAKQIQELQRSLFFKNIHQYAWVRTINQIKQ